MKKRRRIRRFAALLLLAPLTPIHASPGIASADNTHRLGSAVAVVPPLAGHIGNAAFSRARDTAIVPIIQITALGDGAAERSGALDAMADASPRTLPRQIGRGVAVPQPDIDHAKIRWYRNDTGWVGHFAIRATGAETLRAALGIHGNGGEESLPDDLMEKILFRIAGDDRRVFEVSAKEIAASANYWTPLTPGDTIHVEVLSPHALHPASFIVRVPTLSYFAAPPRDTRYRKDFHGAGACQKDVICRTQTPALRRATDAVAKMVYTERNGKSYLCTGTLLNNAHTPKRPLFLTSRHCIQTQSEASSLLTLWFYQTTQCGGPPASIDPRMTQLGGGATLLSAHPTLDMALLTLNQPPPVGAHYQGWSAHPLDADAAVQAIHHPAGDAKKHAIGSIADLGHHYPERPHARITVRWGMADDAGTTESGSSGAGLFTDGKGGLALRGTLNGGWSHCGASFARNIDYFTPFSDFYPSVSQYFGLLY